jgi:hypothetical protein
MHCSSSFVFVVIVVVCVCVCVCVRACVRACVCMCVCACIKQVHERVDLVSLGPRNEDTTALSRLSRFSFLTLDADAHVSFPASQPYSPLKCTNQFHIIL